METTKRGGHCLKAIYLHLSELNIKYFYQAFEVSCQQTD